MVTPRAAIERAAAGPLRLRSYTCLGCGHRSASWAAFRAHRRRCKGFAPPAPSEPPEHIEPIEPPEPPEPLEPLEPLEPPATGRDGGPAG
jgi:hypothetical protein